MSSRALRKLQGDPEILIPGLPAEESDESGPEDAETSQQTKKSSKKNKKKKALLQDVDNPFDLLNEDDDAPVNDDDDDDEQEVTMATEVMKPSAKKKKKKKKKHKDAVEPKRSDNVIDEDDIDASIREVNELLGDVTAQSSSSLDSTPTTTMDMRALLNVEHKNLNPDTEMKRIFGSRVVQAEQSRRRGRQRTYMRATWLAQPKDSWPPMGRTGLSMDLLEGKHGYQYFAFKHNQEYQKVQFKFYEAVESFNPENIVAILHMQPYHINSLLQLSEVCRMSEDVQMATELIERALYSFEVSFHPLFSLTTGVCRLDYRRPENRSFYLCLFRHMAFVGQRGCNRTALEFCKLILSLDPDGDPLCILLMIDFYALRSEQYTFLVRLFQEWEAHRNLSQLPNFAMSVPLAMYHSAVKKNEDTTAADKMLQNSLLMFPGLLMPLLDKCGINPDTEVSSHSFFGTATQLRQPDALKQLIAIYVGRCFSCWKEPEVVQWLERNVREVITRVNSEDPLVEEYRKKCESRYRGTPRNIYRHILISELKDATAALPPEMANTPVLSYDPLPPENSIESYERPSRPNRAQMETNPFTAFFRSLLPNFNAQEIPEVEGAVGGHAQGQDLRQGVNALMVAMRDLLQNIRPVDAPREDDHGAEEGEEEQEWDVE